MKEINDTSLFFELSCPIGRSTPLIQFLIILMESDADWGWFYAENLSLLLILVWQIILYSFLSSNTAFCIIFYLYHLQIKNNSVIFAAKKRLRLLQFFYKVTFKKIIFKNKIFQNLSYTNVWEMTKR